MKSARPRAESICVVLLSGLGDVVNGLPLVNALKRHDPGCTITWVAEPKLAPILEHHPAVDRAVVFDKRRGLRGVWSLWRALRGGRFSLAINLMIYFKSIPPTVLSRAPRRLGFDRPRSRDGVWLFCNLRVRPRPSQHLVDDFLQFLEPLGVPPPEPPEWRIAFTAAERQAQRAFFAEVGRPAAAIVPVSAHPPKDWFVGRWSRLAEALDRDFGLRVILTGGPGEREAWIARAIAAQSSPAPVLALAQDVRRLAWILDGCRVVVAPDTGPLHLARALEVPVVGLYGHTDPRRVGPYRAFQDLWVDAFTDPGEPPDRGHRARKSGRMERITVEQVLERVALALARYPRARHGMAEAQA